MHIPNGFESLAFIVFVVRGHVEIVMVMSCTLLTCGGGLVGTGGGLCKSALVGNLSFLAVVARPLSIALEEGFPILATSVSLSTTTHVVQISTHFLFSSLAFGTGGACWRRPVGGGRGTAAIRRACA